MVCLTPPAPRLLIFDLDGTLIDSSKDLCEAVNAALEHVGRPRLPESRIASFVGDGAATLVQRSLEDTSDNAIRNADDLLKALERFFEFYRLHKLDHTTVYPGVLEALHEIRSKRPALPMAVLTNKPVRPSREICAALGLTPYFFANYGGNSFATKKPHPEGLLRLLSEAQVRLTPGEPLLQAYEAVLVGDSHVDVEAARSAGFRSLGCAYGLAPATLLVARPDALVQHARDWPQALGFR